MSIADLTANLSLNNENNRKREGYLEWEEYFMALAFLTAQRSKDPRCQVGACIVNKDNRVIGLGYNGLPNRASDDEYPWGTGSEDELNNKTLYVCHAEMNAILNNTNVPVRDSTIYVSLFPCNECAKMIIQSGIKEVVYFSDEKCHKPKYEASIRMFNSVGVKYRKFQPNENRKQIVIDFTKIFQ